MAVTARVWDFIHSNERLGTSLDAGTARDVESALLARLAEVEATCEQTRSALGAPCRADEKLALLRLVLASFLAMRPLFRAGRAVPGIEPGVLDRVEERWGHLVREVRDAIREREGEWKPADPERFEREMRHGPHGPLMSDETIAHILRAAV